MKGANVMLVGSVVFGLGMSMHGCQSYVLVVVGGFLWGYGIRRHIGGH